MLRSQRFDVTPTLHENDQQKVVQVISMLITSTLIISPLGSGFIRFPYTQKILVLRPKPILHKCLLNLELI